MAMLITSSLPIPNPRNDPDPDDISLQDLQPVNVEARPDIINNNNDNNNNNPAPPPVEIPAEIQQRVFNLLRPSHSYTGSIYWGSIPFYCERLKFLKTTDLATTQPSRFFPPTVGQPWLWISKLSMFRYPPRTWRRHSFFPSMGLVPYGLIKFYWLPIVVVFGMYDRDCVLGSEADVKQPLLGEGFLDSRCGHVYHDRGAYLLISYMAAGSVLVGLMLDLSRKMALIMTPTCLWSFVFGLAISYCTHYEQSLGAGPSSSLLLWSLWGVVCACVAGEVPITAVGTVEREIPTQAYHDQTLDVIYRGARTVLAFATQVWAAALAGVVWAMVFVIVQGSTFLYSDRVQRPAIMFFLPVAMVFASLVMAYRRKTFLIYTEAQNAWRREGSSKLIAMFRWKSMRPLFTTFLPRLLAISVLWFISDLVFAGASLIFTLVLTNSNQISTSVEFSDYQGHFSGSATDLLLISTCISFVSAIGYTCAYLMVSHRDMGRRLVFLLATAISTVICLAQSIASDKNADISAPLFFFLTLGLGTMVPLIAAESFPTPIRGFGVGIAAGVGKLGIMAMIGMTKAFPGHVEDMSLYFMLLLLVSIAIVGIFIPELAGLSSVEQMRHFTYLVAGQGAQYHGSAVHKMHLSFFERWMGKTLGFGQSDPEEDFRDLLGEIRDDVYQKEKLTGCLAEYMMYINPVRVRRPEGW